MIFDSKTFQLVFQILTSVLIFTDKKNTGQNFPSRFLPLLAVLEDATRLQCLIGLHLHLPSVCLNATSFRGLAILSQEGLNYSLKIFFLSVLLKICFCYQSKKKLKANRFDSSIHNKPLDGYLMRMSIPGIIKQSRSLINIGQGDRKSYISYSDTISIKTEGLLIL